MKLLAAIDIHERPEAFLRVLVPWTRRLGARVDLAHASPYKPDEVQLLDASEALKHQVTRWRDIQRQERDELAALAELLPAEQRGEVRLLQGRALEVIPEATAGYDLVVVGTHGRTGLARALMGSVAERVVRRAEGSVLVLRLDAVPLRVPERPTVVAPIDWPVGPGEALAELRRFVPGEIDLHLVHVVPRSPWQVPHGDPTLDLPVDHVARDQVVRAALSELAASHGFEDVGLHVVEAAGDNVGADIVALCERLVADLVVLPTHGRRGLVRLALGSVAERVVRLAECPVWVTRLRDPGESA